MEEDSDSACMTRSGQKRKQPDVSYDNVNWRQLFLKYDEDMSGALDTNEFTFFIKDLMALRDNNDHVQLEDVVAVAKGILKHPSFSAEVESSANGSGNSALGAKISAKVLQEAANEGAFESEQLSPEYFMLLSGDDDAVPPLLQRVSSDAVRNEQNLRPKVQEAIRRGKLKTQENKIINPLLTPGNPKGDQKKCVICYEDFDTNVMYGGGAIPKICACDVMLCLPCLAASARAQIVEGRRPTCPHMISTSPPRRCTVPIDQSLIAQLFKNVCPLCETSPSDNNPLLSVGCLHDVYHSFCCDCLFDNIHSNLKRGNSLHCPRFAECRGELEESTIRKIFDKHYNPVVEKLPSVNIPSISSCSEGIITRKRNRKLKSKLNSTTGDNGSSGSDSGIGVDVLNSGMTTTPQADYHDVEVFIENWYQQRLRRLRLGYSGSKVCSTPLCQGLLIANLANRRHAQNSSINLNVTCDSCKITQCWKCRSASHGSFSCMQVALCKREWVQFLKVLAGEGNGNPAASEALLKYEQSALDTLYFKRNITEGNLKKCPSCSKLIEKLQGCDSMICGQNGDGGNHQAGCGHTFSWSNVPIADVSDVIDINGSKSSVCLGDDFTLNLTDDHYDITDPFNPIQLQCQSCSERISGTRFICINCNINTAPSLCLSCVRKELSCDSASSQGKSIPAPNGVHSSANMNFSFGGNAIPRPNGGSGNRRHKGHSFQLVAPPVVKSAILSAAVLSVSIEGFLSVESLPPVSYKGLSPNSQGHQPFGFRTEGNSLTTLAMVELRPDGKIVFADNNCRAADWLALDSILFPIRCESSVGGLESMAMTCLDEKTFDSQDVSGLMTTALSDEIPGVLLHGGAVSFQSNMSDESIRYQSHENPGLKCVKLGTITPTSMSRFHGTTRLGVVLQQKAKELFLVIPPAVVRCTSKESTKSGWCPLPSSPNDSYSVSASYVVHGNNCHLAGVVIKDFAGCPLKKRLTDACPISEGDLLAVLPRCVRPISAHDMLVFVDESECKGDANEEDDDSRNNPEEKSCAVVRLLKDGRLYLQEFVGRKSSYPLRVVLDGVRFPISDAMESPTLKLPPTVQGFPVQETERTKHPTKIFCGRKRSTTTGCTCGSCQVGRRCNPGGCPCENCVGLEMDLLYDELGDNSVINAFAVKCKKVIEEVQQRAGRMHPGGPTSGHSSSSNNVIATAASDKCASIFGDVIATTSPDGVYCCLSGQVFKCNHSSRRGNLGNGGVRFQNRVTGDLGSDDGELFNDNPFHNPDRLRNRGRNSSRRNHPNYPHGGHHKVAWIPGDIVATLPEGVCSPSRTLHFVVLAGKGALADQD